MANEIIATVASIDGMAFARAADGATRELRAGDQLREGEVLLTPDGSKVQLTLSDGSPLLVSDIAEMAIDRDMVAQYAAGRDQSAVEDESVRDVLAALERGDDLSEVLDPPAAGATDPASEGHSFVRLARILEVTDEFHGVVAPLAAEPELPLTPNLIPVDAIDDTAITEVGQPVLIDVEANDNFLEGSRVDAVTQPDNGSVVINADDTVTYTPNPGFAGTDTFTYTAVSPDGNGSDTATVTVEVVGEGEIPPTIAIGDDTVVEGNVATVTVTLSAPSDEPVTVAFTTADGSATVSGGDYNPVDGT
ncbi:MAG: retention module-containing protein, partial [Halioglobus sp.]|nr:retention module-containing protein [Halioglobus sp.]